MRFIFAVLLLVVTHGSVVIAQEKAVSTGTLNSLDQVVAAGIALKFEYIIEHVNKSGVDADLFKSLMENLNHDAKSFSGTDIGVRNRKAVKRFTTVAQLVYTEKVPSKNEAFVELMKEHKIDPNTPDPNELSKMAASEVVLFMKTCNLGLGTFRPALKKRLTEGGGEPVQQDAAPKG